MLKSQSLLLTARAKSAAFINNFQLQQHTLFKSSQLQQQHTLFKNFPQLHVFNTFQQRTLHTAISKCSKNDVFKEKNPMRYYEILGMQFSKKAQREPVVTVDYEEIFTKKKLTKKFRATDSIDLADVSTIDANVKEVEKDGSVVFENETTAESIRAPVRYLDQMGFDRRWLQEGLSGLLVRIDEEEDNFVIKVVLPHQMSVVVSETASPDSDVSVKKAILENGIEVKVPGKIAEGDTIRIKPLTLEFVSKVDDDE